MRDSVPRNTVNVCGSLMIIRPSPSCGRPHAPSFSSDAAVRAWSVDGVKKVDNDIEVSNFSGWLDGPSDFIMRTQLATVLLADKSIKDINYTTDVVHGVVYLMGVAQNQGEIDRVV